MGNAIKLGQGLAANYAAIASKDQYTVYFTTDTHQIFVGDDEYTKGTKVLATAPTSSTSGDKDRLYAVNGSLYLCEGPGSESGTYVWTRVANVNDTAGTVTSVAAGEGLETADGNAITSSGTIKHAVATGATVISDPTADASPDFGGTFSIQGVATDKFGHVTASNTRTITLPDETALAFTAATGTATTLDAGDSFTVVTGAAKGTGSHDVTVTSTTFTLPADINTTYSISSTDEGKVTLTPSSGTAQTITIDGWSDLAKKSDITAVFKYKGTVATVSALPAAADVGDVYQVTTGAQGSSEEYVCVTAGDGSTTTAVWEELGPTIDLSAYALTANVIGRVTGEDGEVPKFTADGQLESTGFTLGTSVPTNAVFTDTTYAAVQASTTADPGLMTGADKVKLDGIEAGAEVNIIETVKVAGTALTPDANRAVDVTLSGLGITVSAADLNDINDKLDMTSGGTVAGATTFSSAITATGGVVGDLTGDVTGDVTGNLTGTASNATADAAGNVITETYATKASLEWTTF